MKKLLIMVLMCVSACFTIEEGENMDNQSVIVMETSQGIIKFKLNKQVAPKACENMITHSKRGYYNGLIFHRIIKDFMIQGGDPTGTGMGGESIWGKPFEDEYCETATFSRSGLLAMANAGPSTNGSQFFITTTQTPWLNNRHTIFGEVMEGLDVIKKLEAVETQHGDKPVKDQKIIKMYVQ